MAPSACTVVLVALCCATALALVPGVPKGVPPPPVALQALQTDAFQTIGTCKPDDV